VWKKSRFIIFTSFSPQEKKNKTLSRNVVELQKKVRGTIGFKIPWISRTLSSQEKGWDAGLGTWKRGVLGVLRMRAVFNTTKSTLETRLIF
jgi:hypothetical protein